MGVFFETEIMVGNYVPNNSITFVLNMGLKGNSLHPTLHNRMEWLRGKTTQSQRWMGVCCKTSVFQICFV
jgi:hypothetical protein